MDWRTRHEQHDHIEAQITGGGSLADAADAAFTGHGVRRLSLDAALVRHLEVARAASGRFGCGTEPDGLSE